MEKMTMKELMKKYLPLYDNEPTFCGMELMWNNVKFVDSMEMKRVDISFTEKYITLSNEDYTIEYNYVKDEYSIYGSYYYKQEFENKRIKYVELIKNIVKDMEKIMEINGWNWEVKDELANEVGVCPKCKSEDLDYGVMELKGEKAFYPYICNNCGCKGREWYDLEFYGHDIVDESGVYIEVD